MTKTIIAIAASTLILGGCGAQYTSTIQPEPRTSIVDMSQNFAQPKSMENHSIGMCRALSEYAVFAAEQRQEGYSQKEAQTLMVTAAIIKGNQSSVEGKMAGVATFAVIDRVYSLGLTTTNAQSNVFNWCVRENLPLASYLVTVR